MDELVKDIFNKLLICTKNEEFFDRLSTSINSVDMLVYNTTTLSPVTL